MTRGEIRRLDAMFREAVLATGKCERCGFSQNLEAAHIISKGRGRCNRRTCYLPENGMALCGTCHIYWHDMTTDQRRGWVDHFRGPGTYDRLRLLSREDCKYWTFDQFKEEIDAAVQAHS